MDERFQSLLGRLDRLSSEFRELKEGVSKAIRIADEDPEMALARARKVLEYVIRDVFQRRRKEPPGTRPLENLLQLLVKDGHFPNRLDAYATTIRKLGNVGTHSFSERVSVADVYQSLTQLIPVLEWYFESERPEAMGPRTGPCAEPEKAVPHDQSPPDLLPAKTTIVPKGLRSFDAKDADFFLELLPGPRDKDGLPENIRFWKHRIEETDEPTFTVGLIYGPSGCGKSSLVKAGLLPRLAETVLSLYVEATADETEARLLKGLRRRWPDLSGDLDLTGTIAALRQGQGLNPGQKVFIVLDQFEQWLHAKRSEENTELVRALRQCDGERVQCVVMVRDDFWLAVSRFMKSLDIRLVEGQNSALVDLFETDHARNVLAAHGRAFGKLPEKSTDATKEQKQFLEQAVSGLAEDGKVVCVRLALFAEMMKGKPWTPATLKEVGGTEGVGVTFLEESFSASTAPPDHRYHQKAARAVLKALLPGSGTDIKGHMRSYAELLAASGYADRPKDFRDLIGILDGEIRLITPTDAEGKEEAAPSAVQAGVKYYQLTHDYLVPSLWAWLTRKQKETRRGRAELRLAERSTLWNAKPENRHLPSLQEFLTIRWLTDRKNWIDPQRTMMGKAALVHGIRSVVVATMLLVAIAVGLSIRDAVLEKQNVTRAEGLVNTLVKADIAEVPSIVVDLDKYRRWADPLLRTEFEQATEGSQQRLKMALALLPVKATMVEYLYGRLLTSGPDEVAVIRDAIAPHKNELIDRLWAFVAAPEKGPGRQRLRAGAALATYDPDNLRWGKASVPIVEELVTSNPLHVGLWSEELRSVRFRLLGPLSRVFREQQPERATERAVATSILADYAADQPQVLADLIMDADQKQFAIIFRKLKERGGEGMRFLQDEISIPLPDTEGAREALAKRQANAAVALLKMNHPAGIWPLLMHSPDPRVRTYLIHSLAPLGVDVTILVHRLDEESDLTSRRALILCLGEFGTGQLSTGERQPLIAKLLALYRNDPDPGLHGAVEWVLRQKGWDQEDTLLEIDGKLQVNEKQLQVLKATDKRQWYVNTEGQTFAILNADKPFRMGSPIGEPGREKDEVSHQQRIGRTFAIGCKEVTKSQFRHFQETNPDLRKQYDGLKDDIEQYARTDDSPQVDVDWYDAAWYCNWLSKVDEIPKEQWCYEPNDQGKYAEGMKHATDYLRRSGYRLPTEAEWEYACRSGSDTSRHYGSSVKLLQEYAWFQDNSDNRAWPVGMKKPNDYGLFDMHGNAWQWCDGISAKYVAGSDGFALDDSGTPDEVRDKVRRELRGGSFLNLASFVRSAYRNSLMPTNRNSHLGFRVARTCR